MTFSNETIILSVPVGTGGGGAAIVVAIVVVADGRGAGVVLHYHCRESWGEWSESTIQPMAPIKGGTTAATTNQTNKK